MYLVINHSIGLNFDMKMPLNEKLGENNKNTKVT